MPAVRFASATSESGKRTEYTEPAMPIAPARNMQMPAAFERDRGPRESRGATGGPGRSKSSGRGTHAAGEGDGGGIDASGRTHSIGGGSDRPFSRSALSIPGTERGCDRAYLTVLRGCTLDEERRSQARERTRTFMDAAGHRFRKRRALTMGMRPLQWIIAALVLVLLLGTVAAAASAAGERAQVIVGYRGSLESASRVIQGYGGSVSIAYRNIPALAADVPARAVGAIASAAGIEYVERVQTRQLTTHILPGKVWAGTPEIVPWGVDKVGAPSAWGTTRGDGVRVAVLDTGIDATHPDLAGNLDAAASYDFIDMDEDPSDIPGPYQGHGTLTSGNIAALAHAIRQERVVSEDEAAKSGLLFSVVRAKGSPPIRLRTRGPRSFEEIPPSELQVVARYLLERHSFSSGSDEHLRAVLECFDLKRLTTQVGTTLLEILERRFPYVDEFINRIPK